MDKFADLDCTKNPYGSVQMLWKNAYNPNLILGATPKTYPVYRKVKHVEN